jgi:Arylsulfotransferase (ASST)
MFSLLRRMMFMCVAFPLFLSAQQLPHEGARLNYRLIGFRFDHISGYNGKYLIEVADGNIVSAAEFKKHIVCSELTSDTTTIITVPFFARQYTWRVSRQNDKTGSQLLHHFSTRTIPDMDTAVCRLRVQKSSAKYKDSYVFVDGSNALYDMNGMPVWFPLVKMRGMDSVQSLRNMKASHLGSVTFLCGSQAFEIDYNGKVLWRGPDNGAVSGSQGENYHHQFSHLREGHYMLLGNEWALCQKPTRADSNMHIIPYDEAKWQANQDGYKKIFLGTIMEYDSSGRVVWSWKSSKYFEGSDIEHYRDPKDKYNVDVHENAFYFDEKDSVVYLSFKNIDRLLKIKYPSGDVINAYGEQYDHDGASTGDHSFCGQHFPLHSKDGLLYVYNNNSCKRALPEIIGFQEPGPGKNNLREAWLYTCTVEDSPKVAPFEWEAGGNLMQLPDSNLFVCMGGSYCKIFILNKNKEVLWSALPEHWQQKYNQWMPEPGYRASIVSRKDLETIIWGQKEE